MQLDTYRLDVTRPKRSFGEDPAAMVLVSVFTAALLLIPLALADHRETRWIHIPLPRGGGTAIPHSYPWLVSLQFNDGTHFCGGTLIKVCRNCSKSDIILTAAHCIVEFLGEFPTKTLRALSDFHVVPGLHRQKLSNQRDLAIKNILYHPGWEPTGPSGLKHDIAMIQTEKPIEFSNNIKAIDLQKLTDGPITEGIKCRTAGWGYTTRKDQITEQATDPLQEIDAKIVNGSECLKDYPESDYYYDDKWMTCAESNTGGSTTCQGDSGSALVCATREHGPIAYSIVSFGGNTCGDQKKSVYTTIRPHLMWIYERTFAQSQVMEKEFLYDNLGWTEAEAEHNLLRKTKLDD